MENAKFTLIYDADCPLCKWYTGLFVKYGFLTSQGVVSHGEYFKKQTAAVDFIRSQNEIALIVGNDKQVTYGVDSLIKILDNKRNGVEKIAHIPFIHFLLVKLYQFISYNRKLIAPVECGTNTCSPSFNRSYRMMYILFAGFISALGLYSFTDTYFSTFVASSFLQESLICFLQIPFQLMFLIQTSPRYRWEYVGNLMTVSLMGSLLLLVFHPLLTTLQYVPETTLHVQLIVPVLLFLMIVGVMWVNHFRRVKKLHLPVYLCFTWVLYRIIVLITLITL